MSLTRENASGETLIFSQHFDASTELLLGGGYARASCGPGESADSGCATMAVEIRTVVGGEPFFEWYGFFGHSVIPAGDTLSLHFLIVPFNTGQTLVTLDDNTGVDVRTAFQVSFADGLVNERLPYVAGGWNEVTVTYYFGQQVYRLSVNGEPSELLDFDFPDSNSVQAFSVFMFDGFDAGTTAWLTDFSLRRTGSVEATLFELHLDGSDSPTPALTSGEVGSLEIACRP